MNILVTGSAGFIGFHTTLRLLKEGHKVVGIDNLNDYYSVQLKEDRIKQITLSEDSKNFEFIKMDITNKEELGNLFKLKSFDKVINLAAQAGVRYSIENPDVYIQTNIVGFLNILECCRYNNVKHLVYASSSSVYGGNTKLPFSEEDNVDHPLSLYASSKKANELMAHSYSHLYDMQTTGLRFFTVYGPWGRPDMALFLFTERIIKDEPIDVFNNGKHTRDFTYIDDIVEGVFRVMNSKDENNWRVFNIGNGSPVLLMEYINKLEMSLGKKSKINLLPLQPGDVPNTNADTTALNRAVGYKPKTSISFGIEKFVEWYKEYYEND